jgi:bifunctional protein TilS/HprT
VTAPRRLPGHGTFANDSERRLAELFTHAGIAWVYEPVEFVLEWDVDGKALSAFKPDFYLPDLDRFVELTMLRQPLVTKKNRKLRQLRVLHPDINATIFYRRDFAALTDPVALIALLSAPPVFADRARTA